MTEYACAGFAEELGRTGGVTSLASWRRQIASVASETEDGWATKLDSNPIDFNQDERSLPTTQNPIRRDRRTRRAGHLLQ